MEKQWSNHNARSGARGNSHVGQVQVLYADNYLAVIYKPEGILSVPFDGFKGRTAQSILEEQLRRRGMVNKNHHPFAVHRLDRETSGVMMFALNEASQKKIMDSWHKMVTSRVYRALCYREPRMNVLGVSLGAAGLEGVIDAPLAKNAYNIGFVPKKDSVQKNGKPFATEPARTHYKILSENGRFVLFELELDTGKKNQIRAHLAAAGFPLAGDDAHCLQGKFYDGETSGRLRSGEGRKSGSGRFAENPFGRLCLHARTLEFVHPYTGEQMKFEIPEPPEWEAQITCHISS